MPAADGSVLGRGIPPRPRAILFDWDNTLVDTWPVIHEANNILFRHMGRATWTLEETRKNVRKSLRDSFPVMFGERWEEARDFYYAAFKRIHLEKLAPFRESRAVLEGLSRTGIPLGIVSNKNGAALTKEVAHLGWRDYFGVCAGAGDAPADKPSPEHSSFALRALNVNPGRDIWYVGDTDIDMELAHRAGMTGILVGPGNPEEKPDVGSDRWEFPPDIVLDRFSDLPGLVDKTVP